MTTSVVILSLKRIGLHSQNSHTPIKQVIMMNKKEQAEMDSLRDQLRIAKALRFTEDVLPDVMAPLPSEPGHRLTKGYLIAAYAGWDGDKVVPACSSSVYHNFGSQEKTSSQGSRALYSTRLLALRGLRHEVEKQVASRLASIDKKIEQELSSQPNQ